MQYEMRMTVIAMESPLRSGWFAKIELDGDLVEEVNSTLAGQGPDAVRAVQAALANLASNTPYPSLLIEAALMRGTRTKSREITDGRKKR